MPAEARTVPKIEDGLDSQPHPESDHEPEDDAAQTRAASRPRSRSAKASKPLSSDSAPRGRGAKKQPKVEEHDYDHVPEKRRGGQRAASRKQPEPEPEPELEQGDQQDDDDQDDDDDEGGDGGVTRCVCQEDSESIRLARARTRVTWRGRQLTSHAPPAADEMSSGLMIQCDMCKCWQHGPCVGLWNDKVRSLPPRPSGARVGRPPTAPAPPNSIASSDHPAHNNHCRTAPTATFVRCADQGGTVPAGEHSLPRSSDAFLPSPH